MSCVNCVKCEKERVPVDSPLVHYTCSDMARFVPQTGESLQAALAELRSAKPWMSRGDFALAEQSVGINFDRAILTTSHMRHIARAPRSRYPDCFHNLLASGGIFQYVPAQPDAPRFAQGRH